MDGVAEQDGQKRAEDKPDDRKDEHTGQAEVDEQVRVQDDRDKGDDEGPTRANRVLVPIPLPGQE